MPITCTYRQLDKLRDTQTQKGPISKLAQCESLSIIDKFRVAKLLKAIDAELIVYSRTLMELAQKYGDPIQVNGVASYQLRAGNDSVAYYAAKEDLDKDTCEVLANPLPISAYDIPVLTALDLSLLEPFIVLPPTDDSAK